MISLRDKTKGERRGETRRLEKGRNQERRVEERGEGKKVEVKRSERET